MADSQDAPKSAEITSVDQLFDYVDHFSGSKSRWIFRGVTDHRYRLRPSIGRPDSVRPQDRENFQFDEASEGELVEHFEKAAAPFLHYRHGSTLELCALAQHHGLRTRLLDWTESFLVAAYFAAEFGTFRGEIDAATREKINILPVIYAAPDIPLVTKEQERDFDKIHEAALYYPPHISARIPAQHGVF